MNQKRRTMKSARPDLCDLCKYIYDCEVLVDEVCIDSYCAEFVHHPENKFSVMLIDDINEAQEEMGE